MSYRSKTIAAGAKLAIFVLVSLVVIATIAATIRPFQGSGRHEYRAVFLSASDVKPGDQVRVAGVVSGTVTEVELDRHARAVVTFDVDEDLKITSQTQAQIKYLNLLGNRYVSLSGSQGELLEEGATIPVQRTQPALDLDALFAGFKPLLTALSPDDANALAGDIVATLQGEGGTVTSLLRHTADVTTNLADRDEVIGRVVKNLSTVLASVDSHQAGLNDLVLQLNRYLGGLAADREAIGDSIAHIDAMAAETARLLRDARPSLKADIARLRDVAAGLDTPTNRGLIDEALRTLPDKLARVTRVASYGSWFNFYLCNLRVDIDTEGADDLVSLLLGAVRNISLHDTSPRCN